MASKRVLVVEPSQAEWDFMKEIFDFRGDVATWAPNSKKAMELFSNYNYDLILIEALMPHMSGQEICAQMRRHEVGTPTPILLTGAILRNFKIAHEARIKFGANDILAKPFDPIDLERKLAYYLDGVVLEDREEEAFQDEPETAAEQEPPTATTKPMYPQSVKVAGSLAELGFARLLAAFWVLGEDGVLHIQSGKLTKHIHFHQGNIVYVSGGGRHESLSRILLKRDLIDDETFALSLNKMLETGKPQGEVLIEMGALTPHDLFQMLTIQAQEKLHNLFFWEEGKYWFEPGVSNERDNAIQLPLKFDQILRAGLTKSLEMKKLQEIFVGKYELGVFKTDKGKQIVPKLAINEQERRLWQACNGKNTLAIVLSQSEMTPLASLVFLKMLWLTGAIVFARALKENQTTMMPHVDPLNRSNDSIDEVLRSTIAQRFAQYNKRSLDQILPVPDGAAAEEITRVYQDECRGLFDPSLLERADELTKVKAEKIFQMLTKAYSIRTNPDEWQAYQESRNVTRRSDNSGLQSEAFFQQGLVSFNRGNFVEATDLFQSAIEAYSQTAEYHAYLGYSLFLKDSEHSPMMLSLAIERLNRAIEINPHVAVSYLFLGIVYEQTKKEEKAREMFEKAAECEPGNIEALKHLRAIYSARKTAGGEEGAPTTDNVELSQYIREINEFYGKMNTLNHFEVLGLAEDSDGKSLRQAYFGLSASFHSSAMYELANDAIKEKADEIFNRLTEAYTVLSDGNKRDEYIQFLRQPEVEIKAAKAIPGDRQNAASLFIRGRHAFENGDYKAAKSYFEKAYEFDSRYAANLAWLGFAKLKVAEAGSKSLLPIVSEAKYLMRQALTFDPACIDASILLGRTYLMEGKISLAEEQFDNALQADPDNLHALQGYHQIQLLHHQSEWQPQAKRELTEREKFHRHLLAEFEVLRRQNYFERLDLTPTNQVEEIKEAYLDHINVYSEDELMVPIDESTRALIEDVKDLLSRAYEVLSDESQRRAYMAAYGIKA
ncbi:MAG TPA: DnaJ domain-containing protein [bacterium]|nr:DnaJ domain-containing protein [bacterium]